MELTSPNLAVFQGTPRQPLSRSVSRRARRKKDAKFPAASPTNREKATAHCLFHLMPNHVDWKKGGGTREQSQSPGCFNFTGQELLEKRIQKDSKSVASPPLRANYTLSQKLEETAGGDLEEGGEEGQWGSEEGVGETERSASSVPGGQTSPIHCPIFTLSPACTLIITTIG